MTNTANDRPQEWYDARADHLAEFLTDERRRTLATALAERTRYMTLLAENTFHPHNASALMRHCDAFGVQELHTVETLCKFSPNASIVRGTDKWVDVRRHASTAEAIAALRAEGGIGELAVRQVFAVWKAACNILCRCRETASIHRLFYAASNLSLYAGKYSVSVWLWADLWKSCLHILAL